MVRLVVCGIIFVLLVAAKLLFPGALSSFAQSAGELIGGNADFKEAFAAIGRAISGEEGAGASLQEAYTAVFNPSRQKGEPQQEAGSAAPQAGPEVQPDGTEQAGPQRTGASVPAEADPAAGAERPQADMQAVVEAPVEQEAGETDDTATTEALSYVYTMPALPDNASLEQRNLGFPHSSPILGALSSTFGWREHPVEGGSRFHYGVDLAADTGTEVRCFANGAVTAVGDSSSYGRYCVVAHEGGFSTLYAHCSRITVSSGAAVKRGQKIAEVGDTGMATGPHLHFELQREGTYLNPIYYVSAL